VSQRIVVNGVEYDSPAAMPPDVREQYERALAALDQVKPTGAHNVQSAPGGVKISVTTRRVQYNIDGKTYDDPAQLPPEIRAKVERVLAAAPNVDIRDPGRTDVRMINVEMDGSKRRGANVLLWLVAAAIAAAVIAVLYRISSRL